MECGSEGNLLPLCNCAMEQNPSVDDIVGHIECAFFDYFMVILLKSTSIDRFIPKFVEVIQ